MAFSRYLSHPINARSRLELICASTGIEGNSICEHVEHKLKVVRRHLKWKRKKQQQQKGKQTHLKHTDQGYYHERLEQNRNQGSLAGKYKLTARCPSTSTSHDSGTSKTARTRVGSIDRSGRGCRTGERRERASAIPRRFV